MIDAEHADVVDNDLNMLGLQVFDGLRIRAQEVSSILRFHARRLEDDRGAGRDGMNDLGHSAAFIMPAVGNCFAGGQVDDVARARQEPVFDVGLCRTRVDGVFLPRRGIKVEAVGDDSDGYTSAIDALGNGAPANRLIYWVTLRKGQDSVVTMLRDVDIIICNDGWC